MSMNFSGLFEFASPPRTATTWIRNAAVEAGLTELNRNHVHVPHERDGNGRNVIKVTCVRHPCEWLRSWYASIYPGLIGVDAVDDLRWHVNYASFDAVVRQYLAMPAGWIGRMFNAYNADVVIRVEDLPWSFVEFLESLGVPVKMRERCLSMQPMNVFKKQTKPSWNPSLRLRVEESEKEFIARYDY